MNKDQSSSLPSTALAKLLISISNPQGNPNKQANTIQDLLQILKHKKNPNHEKFASHIQKQLIQQKIEIFNLIQMIIRIGKKCQSVQNTDSQIKSISLGIKRYIQKNINKQNWLAKDKKKFIQEIINNIFQFYQHFSVVVVEVLSNCIRQLANKQQQLYEKQVVSQIIDRIKNRNISVNCCRQACTIIHYMNLYQYFRIPDLVHFAAGTKSADLSYFFKNKNGTVITDLIQAYVMKQKDQKYAMKLIQKLNLKTKHFPTLIKQLSKKALRYFMKQLEIYSLDLIVAQRSDIAESLVQLLLDDRKLKQALHFINKHYLTKFYHLNPTQDRSYNKNILIDKDKFLPTEHILSKYFPKYKQNDNHLCLSQFGYQQKNVHFINSQNLTIQHLQNISNSQKIGIDCQNRLVFNAYQANDTEIWQIALSQKVIKGQNQKDSQIKYVYILDFYELKNNQMFKDWFSKFCCEYKGKIVGHTVKKDFQDLILEIGLKNIQQKVQKLHFIDVASKFKQINKQTKSSLQYICGKVFGRSLSKFQQKSGWNNRPLRKAQLHYAALDAVLPLKIYQKL